jgi:hypothetical protein
MKGIIRRQKNSSLYTPRLIARPKRTKNPKKNISRVAQTKPAAFPRIIFNVENLTSNYVADIAEL